MMRTSKEQILSYVFFSMGFVWILVLVWGIWVNRQLGIMTLNDIDNAQLILSLVHEKPIVLVFPSLDFLLGFSIIGIAVVSSHLSEPSILNDLQKYTGLFAGVFFIYGAYSRVTTFQKLANSSGLPDELKYFGYDIVNYLQYGNSFAVQGFLSLWMIAFHWLRRKKPHRNNTISLIGITAGFLGLLAFIFQPLSGIIILTNTACSFYWCAHYKRQSNQASTTDSLS